MTWDLPTETAATHELMIFFPSCSGKNANWNIGMILFSSIYSIIYILDILMAFWVHCTIYPKKSGKNKNEKNVSFLVPRAVGKSLCLYKPKMIWSPVYPTIGFSFIHWSHQVWEAPTRKFFTSKLLKCSSSPSWHIVNGFIFIPIPCQ